MFKSFCKYFFMVTSFFIFSSTTSLIAQDDTIAKVYRDVILTDVFSIEEIKIIVIGLLIVLLLLIIVNHIFDVNVFIKKIPQVKNLFLEALCFYGKEFQNNTPVYLRSLSLNEASFIIDKKLEKNTEVYLNLVPLSDQILSKEYKLKCQIKKTLKLAEDSKYHLIFAKFQNLSEKEQQLLKQYLNHLKQ